MQKILSKKTVSMTDMRDPAKVLEFANGETVAVLNRNKTVGYFTPASVVEKNAIEHISDEVFKTSLEKVKKDFSETLDYLKDK